MARPPGPQEVGVPQLASASIPALDLPLEANSRQDHALLKDQPQGRVSQGTYRLANTAIFASSAPSLSHNTTGRGGRAEPTWPPPVLVSQEAEEQDSSLLAGQWDFLGGGGGGRVPGG